MPGDPNVERPEWDADFRETPARSRVVRLGAAAGASQLGASLYELEPGGAPSPLHFHHANEELLIVLRGRPRLQTPEGARQLVQGAVVAFPAGPDGAHRVSNPSDEPVRILIVSTMHYPEIAEHVRTGATLAMTGPGVGKAFPGGAEGSLIELLAAAFVADAES